MNTTNRYWILILVHTAGFAFQVNKPEGNDLNRKIKELASLVLTNPDPATISKDRFGMATADLVPEEEVVEFIDRVFGDSHLHPHYDQQGTTHG